MEGLDIKIIERREDLHDILDELGYLGRRKKWGEDDLYFAAAALNREFAGFWQGGLSAQKMFEDVKFEKACFFSTLFVSRGRDFGVAGVGIEMKRHQLKFAQGRGYSYSYSEVGRDNIGSLKIQKKLGADMVKAGDIYRCSFDLERLRF